jgi:hypothetical protein
VPGAPNSLARGGGERRNLGTSLGTLNPELSRRGVAHYGASSEGRTRFPREPSELIMPGSRVRVPPLLSIRSLALPWRCGALFMSFLSGSGALATLGNKTPPSYGPDMRCSGRYPRGPRVGRTIKLVMLLLGIASVPGVGVAALERPHCGQYELAGHHEPRVTSPAAIAHHQIQQTWTPRHAHECPHCPASECARVSACTGSSITAVAPTCVAVADTYGRGVTTVRLRHFAHSAVCTPPTPPPQVLA